MQSKTLLSLLAATGAFLHAEMASGQAVPPSVRTPQADQTLGTQVSGNGNNFNVTGGLNRGQTLFHSFKDFSIPTGGAANFNNPAGTRDIITRVTGNLFSDINGTLNSNGANFLLINPNGVVFGPNARLNVGKAFAASTASGVDLIDGQGGRYTFGTNPNGDAPLLKVNPNVFFNVSQLNMGAKVPGNAAIINYGTLQNQTNNSGQYIGLIGGDVGLIGGGIIAPGGKVELAGLSQAGGIGFSFNKGVQFPANVGRGDVVLVTKGTSPSVIDVQSAGGGGSVDIFAKDITLRGTGTNITTGISAGSSSPTTTAGDIKLDATGKIELSEANIFNQVAVGGVGKGGNIEINTRNLSLTNGSQLGASTFGIGDAGNIKITATGDISSVEGTAFSTVEQTGVGKGGNVEINTRNLSLTNGGQLQTTTRGKGDAGNVKITATGDISVDGTPDKNGFGSSIFSTIGDTGNTGEGKGGSIEINTRNLSLTNGGQLQASTFGIGDAGNVKITASGDISFDGTPSKNGLFSEVFSDVQKGGEGKGGNVEINTRNLSLTNGAQIQASTKGKGNAGNIKITATGDISVDGTAFSSVEEGAVGKGGNIEINTRNLSLINGAQIAAGTTGKGDAGNVKITATDKISFDGINNKDGSRAAALSNVEKGGEGKAGNVEINTRNLSLTNGGSLASSTFGKGDAGNVKITATDDVSFDGFGSSAFSTVEQTGVGKGGNIEINTRNLSFTNGAESTASTKGKGDAGNIKITASGDISFDGFKNDDSSGVSSNVEQTGVGKGGNIEINTRNLSLTNIGQIQAATVGKGDAGNIKITATGDISVDGFKDSFSSGIFSIVQTGAVGKGGNIEINTRNISLTNNAQLTADTRGQGDAGNVKITATGDISLDGFKDSFSSGVFSIVGQGAVGKGGNIDINTRNLSLTNGAELDSSTRGKGEAGNISLNASTIKLNNGKISSTSTSSTGGDLNITTQDYLLLRNNSKIATNSDSTTKNGNGGNITINSPLIVALPGNNDISANAFQGSGGKVNITSQGLFGIKFRPKGQDSLFTNDITASSTFGQSGTVNISTPGTDPGKDSTVLPNVPTDASNQIAQACGASRENKFVVAGRGGIPSNANDPLTSDVVWQDARGANSQPTASSATTDPTKLAPPATGLVFDGKGKATLIAAGTEGQPTGTSVVCPSVVRK
jgi:filamentous hemagglutinin family protein